MTENKRFKVMIEKGQKSACIFDKETSSVYLLTKFTKLDRRASKKAFIDDLYRICDLLNDLNDRRGRI